MFGVRSNIYCVRGVRIWLNQILGNFIMKSIINFYDQLFTYFYNLKKNSDDTPEYFPIIIITVGQTGNLLLLAILLFHILRIDFAFLPNFFLFLGVVVLVFNWYVYKFKERMEIILQRGLRITFGFRIFSYFYILISFVSPLFLIHFLKEFF